MKYADYTVNEFMELLSSGSSTPGGGGASALAAAIGISLGNMLGELTVGKKKYADVEEDIRELMVRAQDLRQRFLDLIDQDAIAFEPLSRAYGIPKEDPNRDEILEDALRGAARVPMDIMHTCCEALDVLADFAAKGSRLMLSDAGCGAILCKAALKSASFNVFVNTKLMKDREYAESLDKEADQMLVEYSMIADRVYNYVVSVIR